MANAVVGRVLLIPKGNYSASVSYNMLDLVRYDNKSWVCKQTCTGQTPQEGDYWQLMASDGAEGTYCYIKYSANADGSDFVSTPTSDTTYIGFYTGDSETAPTEKTDYAWSKYAGIDGTSPIASVEQTATGVKITITDKDGTTTADITNGTDGTNASASVSKTGKVATITCQTGDETPTEVVINDGNDGSDGVSMDLAGEWASGTAYVNDGVQIDIVSKSGNSYGCLQSHTASSTNQPPNAAYWQLLAQKGADGSGTGDMNKSTYDTDNDGVVDMAETLNGLTASVDELNYTDGVTGNVQEQLNGKAPTEHDHTVSDITDFPSSMPASDVPSWAKQEDKPTYTASEVGAGDMLASVYATNGSTGVVDTSNRLRKYVTASSGTTYANQWTKVAKVTFTSSYQDENVIFSVINGVNAFGAGIFSVRVGVGATVSIDAGTAIRCISADKYFKQRVGTIKLVYTAPVYELWFSPTDNYSELHISILNETYRGIGFTWLENQPYQATQPTGTVITATLMEDYLITDLTAETAIADADYFMMHDTSAVANRKTLWSNIKSTLETYFNTKYNNYVLPKATTSTLGGIKPDGTTITVDENGVASSAGASGTILDSGTAIKNNTTADQICGALGAKDLFDELDSNLGDLAFAQDAYGKWGYKVGGADPVIPFKSGCEAVSTTTTATIGTYTIVSNALSSGKICIWVKRNAGVGAMPYSGLHINGTEIASKQQSQEEMVYYECDYNIGDTITIKLKSGDHFSANIYSVVSS